MNEKVFRTYIKQLIVENLDSRIQNQIKKLKDEGLSISISWTDESEFEVTIVKPNDASGLRWFPSGHGVLQARDATESFWDGSLGECGGAFIVGYAEASDGLGPLLYDVAIEFAGIHGTGLTPDREHLSRSAYKVWEKYLNSRPDVTVVQMDNKEHPRTDPESDDCHSSSSDTHDPGKSKSHYLETEKRRTSAIEWWFSNVNPISKYYRKTGTPVMDLLKAEGLIVGDWKELHEGKYVKSILKESEEPDMSKYVDDLEDEIFSFLFQRKVYDSLQSQNSGQTVLDTKIFDDYENINEIHLEVLVNDEGVADVFAAYVCVPNDRKKSNLILSLNIPREYPHVDGFQDWLSAELADALSHEIQHSCDTSEMLGGDIPEGEEKWASLENIEKYYASDAETRGHVAGILGRSRRTGQDPEALLQYDIETIMMSAADRGYSEDDMVPVVQRIYKKWSERLESRK